MSAWIFRRTYQKNDENLFDERVVHAPSIDVARAMAPDWADADVEQLLEQDTTQRVWQAYIKNEAEPISVHGVDEEWVRRYLEQRNPGIEARILLVL